MANGYYNPQPEPSGGSSGSLPGPTTTTKSFSLNNHRFDITTQVVSLSKLSLQDRNLLAARLTGELTRLRAFQKKLEAATKTTSISPQVRKKCEALLKSLLTHKHAWVFNKPVDIVALNIPDYFSIIKKPMDLGTIQKKLATKGYKSVYEFADDVRLTFTNAMTYNPPGNTVHGYAVVMSEVFEKGWKVIEKKLPPPPVVVVEKEVVGPSKKRKVASLDEEVKARPEGVGVGMGVKRVMSAEEKGRLSREIEELMDELPESIIEFLKQQCSPDMAEDELEIDLDVLSNEVLFKLRGMLDEFLQARERSQSKLAAAEPCVIEVVC